MSKNSSRRVTVKSTFMFANISRLTLVGLVVAIVVVVICCMCVRLCSLRALKL